MSREELDARELLVSLRRTHLYVEDDTTATTPSTSTDAAPTRKEVSPRLRSELQLPDVTGKLVAVDTETSLPVCTPTTGFPKGVAVESQRSPWHGTKRVTR